MLGIDAEHPPRVFLGDKPKPLKIGVHLDLIARFPGAKPAKVRRWLARWTHSRRYLEAIAKGIARYDLDGGVAGEISELEHAHARQSLEQCNKGKKPPATISAGRSVSSYRGPRKPTLHLPNLATKGN